MVTFNWNHSPFRALEELAITNGYQLAKEGGSWTVVPVDPGGVEAELDYRSKREGS